MGLTQIIKRNGEIINLNITEPFRYIKQATLTSSLMGDDYITLQIVSSEWLSFEKGDKINLDGFDYSIRTTTTRTIEGENYYTFEPIFYGPMYDLIKTIYRNCDANGKSDRSTFDLTYTIKEFVKVIINNLNRDYPGLWAFDELNCPDTEAITIQFSGVNCLQVLQTICGKDNFNLEFLISQNAGVRTIHIGKFGQRVNPPGGAKYFEWGKGNGLYKLKEQKVDDKAIITRLWVEGGSTNIRTDYRNYSERLQLPYPPRYNQFQHTLYDGTIVEPNTMLIGITNDNDRFLEDVTLRNKIGSEEDCKTYDNIYPTRTGKVTALVDGDIYGFIDDTMDFDLCAKDDNGTIYLVNEVSAKINFTSGRLAGQQFELEAKGGYNHESKKFRLIPFTDKRGLTTPTEPNGAFPIEVGDTYKITDIFLPESYEKRAEEDLWFAGYNDFKPATQAKAQYSLTLDRLYFLDALSRDSDVSLFKVGDYVPIRDTRYGIEKQIRIQKITRNLLLEQDYQLTLSDTTAISVQSQTVLSVIEHNQIINNNRLRDLNKARRGWRTTEDLRSMVYDTDGYFDIDNIRPNSIDTNMLTVGSKSQQFVLTGVILQANLNGDANRFSASEGILSHLTIDPNKIRNWEMSAAIMELSSVEGYYLFAKCSKTEESGMWLITQTRYKVEPDEDANNYYFQVGILSKLYPDDNFRDFQTTYGFTRINGNTITTGRIVTSDGECYLDLDGNKFRIGDASSSIDWNVSRNHGITLKNVSVVSESGDVSPLGVFRGIWNKDYTYYPGDEVIYTTNGMTCTYRYVYGSPTKGHLPTQDLYWNIIAQGANGQSSFKSSVFKRADAQPPKPTGGSYGSPLPTEGDWSDGIPSENNGKPVWLSSRIFTNDGKNPQQLEWSTPTKVVDTADIDFEFSDVANNPGNPTQTPNNWHNTATDSDIWMAIRKQSNGSWGEWEISKIKGENGIDGVNGINGDFIEYRYAVSGSKTSPNATLDAAKRNPGSSWKTTMPSVGTLEYLWLTTAKINGETNALRENWTTPIRVTPYDGVDGQKGDSPALVFRGIYDSNATYYGNKQRVDAVKYNNHFYVRAIDNSTTKGVLPTTTSKWNDFGAEFESIATGFLLAENANIAGFIFKDNKLIAQNGSAWLDGVNGKFRLAGTIQLSTAFSGNISDVNLFILPAITSNKSLTMGYEAEDIGKVCRLFNSSPIGGATYTITCNTFAITENKLDAILGAIRVQLAPQEVVELTCFEANPITLGQPTTAICGKWYLTNRFAPENFRNEGAEGRFPRMLAMGRIVGSSTGATISGRYWDGRALSELFLISRLQTGEYKATVKSGAGIKLTADCKVFCNGYGLGVSGSNRTIDARTIEVTNNSFTVAMSDDNSLNDATCDFMILDDKWYYPMGEI